MLLIWNIFGHGGIWSLLIEPNNVILTYFNKSSQRLVNLGTFAAYGTGYACKLQQ